MVKVINGKRYDTDTASLVAHDRYWDGHNFERGGRNHYLYVTRKGNFFLYCTSLWQGELPEDITPITADEAKEWYGQLPIVEMEYSEAFGEEPEDA